MLAELWEFQVIQYQTDAIYIGRRIVFFHVNIHLLNQKPATTLPASSDSETPATVSSDTQTYLAPVPFTHPDYKNIDGATYEAVGELTADNHLGDYARLAGIPQVMRWKPMNVKIPINLYSGQC